MVLEEMLAVPALKMVPLVPVFPEAALLEKVKKPVLAIAPPECAEHPVIDPYENVRLPILGIPPRLLSALSSFPLAIVKPEMNTEMLGAAILKIRNFGEPTG